MKQVIVMRTDLSGMATGKMCAQAAHASLGAVLPYVHILLPTREERKKMESVRVWLKDSFTKIVLRVNSEEELRAVYDKAERAGLIAYLITDAGRTVFKGEATVTCCAIGPATDEELKPITGELKVL